MSCNTCTFTRTHYFSSSLTHIHTHTHIHAHTLSGWGAGNEDVFIVKTDSLGVEQWSAAYGGLNDDRGFAMCEYSGDNGIVVAGSWYVCCRICVCVACRMRFAIYTIH
jgi:hypothetical protein